MFMCGTVLNVEVKVWKPSRIRLCSLGSGSWLAFCNQL